ncbi:MAG: DNA repair protein [Rhodobacteraceae bacterium]|nr:DNA repair protein [Paracoccaceae bacterium]
MTFLSAVGAVPWLYLPMQFGAELIPWAGAALQIGVTALLLMLCVFLPSSLRVLRLETSHRDFSMRMDDIAQAYWLAHRADREGVFTLPREFDAVRERYMFLRAHPDLESHEPELLELAAQMSHESRELAEIYSDAKVARAREMLALRRQEAETLSDRIGRAHAVTDEIKRQLDAVEVDEDVARSRLSRLRAELAELMPSVDRAVGVGKGNDLRPRLRVAKAK